MLPARCVAEPIGQAGSWRCIFIRQAGVPLGERNGEGVPRVSQLRDKGGVIIRHPMPWPANEKGSNASRVLPFAWSAAGSAAHGASIA